MIKPDFCSQIAPQSLDKLRDRWSFSMWYFWLGAFFVLLKIYNRLSSGICYSDTVMMGKVVIVTGANSGIGFQTAMEIAKRGAKVILACRDDVKGKRAEASIKKVTKNNLVRYEYLDLSSLASIRKFVDEFKQKEAKLDVLINNAGASGMGGKKTADGIVRDMQVNHFGPFLLTILLVPWLKKGAPGRIVNVSSYFHRFGTIEDINEEGRYSFYRIYANSKLCNILFSNELARRLEDTDVVVNSLNPGQVNTSFYKNAKFLEKLRSMVLFTFFKSPWEGAQTSIFLAISDDCDFMTGKYFMDCEESKMSFKATDEEDAMRLWRMSEELVNLKPEEAI
ncbi:retinol dehydrogenase 12-like [Cydia strobilella]|uniref:retinol dehydrogenase 12-like n=1 Tax=Cydia strobilella TaxID=1100964 RepID=UPI0030067E6B